MHHKQRPASSATAGRLVARHLGASRRLERSLLSGPCPSSPACLTLAWVYRTGRDLLAPRAGLLAALLLSASVFFLAYMIHARAFTLIALCSTLCIWSYWRLVLNPRPTGMGPAGRSAARQRWPALFALLHCAVSACPRPVSFALRPEEPALVAARPPDRRRCLACHAATARLSAGTG